MNTELKPIFYSYLFNYFGGDTFNGEVITGASIDLAIYPYKNDEIIKFSEEPKAGRFYLCDVFNVSYDNNEVFKVKRNLFADNAFRILHGFDKIECEVVGYNFDYASNWTDEQLKDMPEIIKNMPVSRTEKVNREDFESFIKAHEQDFDISDNKNAQVPAYGFVSSK